MHSCRGRFIRIHLAQMCFHSAVFHMTAPFVGWILFCLHGDNLNRRVFNQLVKQKHIHYCWHLGIVSYKEFHTNNAIISYSLFQV